MAIGVQPFAPASRPPAGSMLSGWSSLTAGVLDLLREGVLVLAPDGRVLGANRAARALLREGDGIVSSSRGVVASTPGATLGLRRAIEVATNGRVACLQVPRDGRSPLSLRAEPHPDEDVGPVAVLFVADAESNAPRVAVLMARFGLTPTEAAVTRWVVVGATLEQISQHLEITANTIRGHLKQIFAKTGTHRQVELVSKVLSEI